MTGLDQLIAIGRRIRGFVIPVTNAAPTPPEGFATLFVDRLTGTLAVRNADGTTTRAGSGGGGGAPSGSASGDLGGTYPSPTVTRARGLRTSGGTTIPLGVLTEGEILHVSGGDLVTLAAPSSGDRNGRVLGYSGTSLAWIAMPLVGILGRGDLIIEGRGITDVPNCVTTERL